jgi:phage baseplate assembly protein gpV
MSESRRRFFGLRLRTLVWLVLLTTVALSVYSYWSDYAEERARRERELLAPSPGGMCTVVLRGDALGLEKMPAHASEVNGIANYVRGRFVNMNDQWLKLDGASAGDPQQWIPRENVLLIQVADE